MPEKQKPGRYHRLKVAAAIGSVFACFVGAPVSWTFYNNRPDPDFSSCDIPSQWYSVTNEQAHKAERAFATAGMRHQAELAKERSTLLLGQTACSPALEAEAVNGQGVVVQTWHTFVIDQRQDWCVAIQQSPDSPKPWLVCVQDQSPMPAS